MIQIKMEERGQKSREVFPYYHLVSWICWQTCAEVWETVQGTECDLAASPKHRLQQDVTKGEYENPGWLRWWGRSWNGRRCWHCREAHTVQERLCVIVLFWVVLGFFPKCVNQLVTNQSFKFSRICPFGALGISISVSLSHFILAARWSLN